MNEVAVRLIVAKFTEGVSRVEPDQLDNFLAQFKNEIIKALGKNTFEELSNGAKNLVGNNWILIDTLNGFVPEKFIECVCR